MAALLQRINWHGVFIDMESSYKHMFDLNPMFSEFISATFDFILSSHPIGRSQGSVYTLPGNCKKYKLFCYQLLCYVISITYIV